MARIELTRPQRPDGITVKLEVESSSIREVTAHPEGATIKGLMTGAEDSVVVSQSVDEVKRLIAEAS